MAFVRGIEEHHIAVPPLRDAAQNLIDQIPVRIEDRDPFAAFDVLHDELEEQGRFARAGCADHVAVLRPLFGAERHRRCLARMGILPEDEGMTLDDLGSCFRPGIFALELRDSDGCRGQMRQGNQFVGVEEHPGTVRCARENVRCMICIVVSVVRERNEFIARRIRELRESAAQGPHDLPGSRLGAALRGDAEHHGIEGRRDLLPCLGRHLRRIREE